MFVIAYVQGTEQFPSSVSRTVAKSSPFPQRLQSLMLRKCQEKWGEGWGLEGGRGVVPCRRLFLLPMIQKKPGLRPAPPPPHPPLLMVSTKPRFVLGHMWNQPSTLAPFAKASKGPCSILMWTGWKGRGASGLESLEVGHMSPWKLEKGPFGH